MKSALLGAAGAAALAAVSAVQARAEAAAPSVSPVLVTADRPPVQLDPAPQTIQTLQADAIGRTVNVVTTEDALKYLPDVLIRQRHPGDTQDPITTRTSGVGSSARSLVYADGVLLSALIGNNNSNASPRWGMVAPDEIQRIEVLYGPFAAAFPGNSIGEVVQITTRMPTKLEGSASAEGAWQSFSQYGTHATYPSGRLGLTLGDRIGPWSFWISANRLQSRAQPLTYATATTPAASSAAGTPVSGAYADANRLGQPIAVLGATALETQAIDNDKIKLAYDVSPQVTVAYSLGYFANRDDAGVQTYLRDASGAPVYAGAVNIAGRAYTLAPSVFSASVYRLREQHVMQSLTAGSHAGGLFDWAATASAYDYVSDQQRGPSAALPSAQAGGPGTLTSMNGTGWRTLDGKGVWRPQGADGANLVSFGAHYDRFVLNNPKYNLADWTSGSAGPLASLAQGKTDTAALWAQDVVRLSSILTLTLGARYEQWRAYDGRNLSASPALDVAQPSLSAHGLSPKAVLAFTPNTDWRLTASVGRALRFPTVTELYQAITTGPTLTSPNPNLKPEDALSAELSAQRLWRSGSMRLSVFDEQVANALISQTAPLAPGSNTLFSYVQNIGRTHARGVELVASQSDVLIPGLDLSGWATYVDARVTADPAFPAAVGKSLPQLPHLRGSVVVTYRASDRLSLTLAGRYSDRAHAAIDNSDGYANTYQGFSAYFVADIHAQWRLDERWTWSAGVDNLLDRRYFLFHPFPQRTVSSALSYRF